VNFEIGAGQSVAFMDVSGRIPTTVMDLLLGFYTATAGKVLVFIIKTINTRFFKIIFFSHIQII
jgi:ABC-type multidrug transport system fused ATPase/permease subunit